jgi:hypothetical protein
MLVVWLDLTTKVWGAGTEGGHWHLSLSPKTGEPGAQVQGARGNGSPSSPQGHLCVNLGNSTGYRDELFNIYLPHPGLPLPQVSCLLQSPTSFVEEIPGWSSQLTVPATAIAPLCTHISPHSCKFLEFNHSLAVRRKDLYYVVSITQRSPWGLPFLPLPG